jgi:hypothetical protein
MWQQTDGAIRRAIDRTTLAAHARQGRGRRWVWEVWDGDGACVARGVAATDTDAMRAAERAFVRDRSWMDRMDRDDLRACLAWCEECHANDPDAGWDELIAAARRALMRRSGDARGDGGDGGDGGAGRRPALDLDD